MSAPPKQDEQKQKRSKEKVQHLRDHLTKRGLHFAAVEAIGAMRIDFFDATDYSFPLAHVISYEGDVYASSKGGLVIRNILDMTGKPRAFCWNAHAKTSHGPFQKSLSIAAGLKTRWSPRHSLCSASRSSCDI
jgi:hypothetical protein